MHRRIWFGVVSALILVGCRPACDTEVTLNGDNAQSASLVWNKGSASAVSATYIGRVSKRGVRGCLYNHGG